MNHSRLLQILSSYVDGELSGEERSTMESHVRNCPECTKRIAQYAALTNRMRSAASMSLPASFPSDVLRMIRLNADETKGWIPAEFMARRILVGLSLVVLLAFGFTSLSKNESPVTAEGYLRGEMADSAEAQILMNSGDLSREDVLLAAVSKR